MGIKGELLVVSRIAAVNADSDRADGASLGACSPGYEGTRDEDGGLPLKAVE